MRRLVIVIGLIAFLALDCWSQGASNLARGQDEDGGVYDLTWGIGLSKYDELRALVRSFIWTRWKSHTRGRLLVTLYTLEGSPRKIKVFIETLPQGHWQISMFYDATDYPMPPFKGEPRKRTWIEF